MSRIRVDKFDPKKHWLMLQNWWSERKFKSPPLNFLPPTGAIVNIHNTPVCAGFLTKTDANCAVIGHLVSDPRVFGEHRHEALDALLFNLINEAQNKGFHFVFASTNLPDLQKRYEKHGLLLTDEKINVYGRDL